MPFSHLAIRIQTRVPNTIVTVQHYLTNNIMYNTRVKFAVYSIMAII